MSETAKGPWSRDKYGSVVDADGKEVLFRSVSTLSAGTDDRIAMAEANTDLAAAAPELLEALERLVGDFEAEIHNEYDGTSMLKSRLSECDYARAAIAKARSQS